KFDSGWLGAAQTLTFYRYLLWGTVYALIAVLVGFYSGLYAPRRRTKFTADVWKVIQVHGLSFVGLLSVLYFAKQIHVSREMLGIFLGLNLTVIIVYRYAVKAMLFRLRKQGYNKKFVLIL